MEHVWLFDFLIPSVLLYYGYSYLYRTPGFESFSGLGVPSARRSQEAWSYAHRTGGKIYLTTGGLAAGYYFLTDVLAGGSAAWLDMIVFGIQLLCLLGVIPFTDRLTGQKFPDKTRGA